RMGELTARLSLAVFSASLFTGADLRFLQLLCSPRVLEQMCIKRDDSRSPSTMVEEQLSSSIRILIADDFRDWRRQVLSLFEVRPEWQVIAEATDGPEAIQKAAELKPDLI